MFKTSFLLTKIYPEFVFAIKSDVIVEDNFNYYGYTNNSFQFCKSCYSMIILKKISKFEFVNCINVLPC